MELIKDLRGFISRKKGAVTTAQVIQEFGGRVENNALFKSLLMQLCTFKRRKDVGFWHLKEDFR